MKPVDALTRQERSVLALVAKGHRNADIARELVISIRTVETHLYHIFAKLNVSSRTEAAIYALGLGAEIRGIAEDGIANSGYSRHIS